MRMQAASTFIGLIYVVISSAPALALPVRIPVVNIGSGIDRATNLPLAAGTLDSNYTLTAVPAASPPELVALIGTHPTVLPETTPAIPDTYLTGSPNSRWLGVINSIYVPNSYYLIQENPYIFETRFDLTAAQSANAQIDGLRTAIDNKLIGIRINGVQAFSAPVTQAEEFHSFKDFPDGVGLNVLQPGTNTVQFVLDNHTSAPSPLALRIEGQVTVPEPACTLMATLGVGALAMMRRRLISK